MLVAIACGLVEELLVHEGHQRAVALSLESDCHQRFTFRRCFPCPREYELLVLDDFAIDAADIVLLTITRLLHHDAESAANSYIRFSVNGPNFTRTHPMLQFFRVGPRRKDFRRRCVEPAPDGEAGLGCDGGHLSSSRKAARRSNRSVQNF